MKQNKTRDSNRIYKFLDVKVKCLNCGKEFNWRNPKTNQHKTKFCSNLCGKEFHTNKRRNEKYKIPVNSPGSSLLRICS